MVLCSLSQRPRKDGVPMSTVHLDFDRVKREITIPDVLREFGILDRFTQTNGRLRGQCPIASHVHNPIKPNSQQFVADCRKGIWLFRCFSPECLAGGDVTELVKRLASLEDYGHVRLWFLDRFPQLAEKKSERGRNPTTVDNDTKKASEDVLQDRPSLAIQKSNPIVSLPLPALKPLRWFYNLDQKCDYLLQTRRLKPSTLQRFGIGRCSRGYLRLHCHSHLPARPT